MRKQQKYKGVFEGEGWLSFELYRRWAKFINRKLFKTNQKLKRERNLYKDEASQLKVKLEACQERQKEK